MGWGNNDYIMKNYPPIQVCHYIYLWLFFLIFNKMATIKIEISKRGKASEPKELKIRFSYKRGCVFRLRSGIFVKEESWNATKEKVVIPRMVTKQQKELKQLQSKIDSLLHFLKTESITAPKNADKNYWQKKLDDYHGISNEEPEIDQSMDALFKEYLKTIANEDTRKQKGAMCKAVIRFMLYKRKKIKLEAWNAELLAEFRDFLSKEHTFFDDKGNCCVPRLKNIYSNKTISAKRYYGKRGDNYLFDIMKRFRTFFNWCIKNGKLVTNPFKGYKLEGVVYGTPFFMNLDELKKLYLFDFTDKPDLAIQRDIFVLQSNLGMRVGDFYSLTRDNIIAGAIEYIPSKTKTKTAKTIRVPLSKRAKEILDRYYKDGQKDLMPFVNEQKYNKAIKKMLQLAGIDRIVTVLNPTTRLEEQHPIYEVASSHMARRNFIGNLYSKVQDPNLISSMTGHKKGSTAFERYRTIDDDIKKNVLDALDN